MNNLSTNYQVKLTLTSEMLGTVPKDKNVYKSFVATKAPPTVDTDEEIETVPVATLEEIEQRGWTSFHQDEDGIPFIYSYMLRGFFKEACSSLRRNPKSLSNKLLAFKKVIDGGVFVNPRRIYPKIPKGKKIGVIERPLRAETPQGPRVCLVRSDTLPEGTTMTFKLQVLDPKVDEKLLREWLDYGELRALGQWRNAGYGTIEYTLKKMK